MKPFISAITVVFAASSFMAAVALAVAAPPIPDIENYLTACMGATAENQFCESSQKQFKRWYPEAFKGNYQGQRNVAYCLNNGCDGAVTVRPELACAWRIVILAAGHLDADSSDVSNKKYNCEKLDLDSLVLATSQSQGLIDIIYSVSSSSEQSDCKD